MNQGTAVIFEIAAVICNNGRAEPASHNFLCFPWTEKGQNSWVNVEQSSSVY